METASTLPWQAAAPGRERRLATVGVLLALVVAAFETTVVTTAMPTLTAELNGRAFYAWVFTGFLLASTLGVLLGGRLSDRLGRRGTFVGGMGLFLLGSVLCGFSTSVPMLVAFRVLQGLGAGAVQPTTLTISSDLYTLEERAAIQSVFTGAWGLASVIGPVVGGLLTEHLGWRSVFWVNVPVGLLAVVMLRRSYRDPPRKEQARFEVGGPALGALSVTLILLGLEPGALSIPAAAGVLLAAALVAWAFVRQQQRSVDPLIPPAVLRDRTVRAGLLGGLVTGGVLYTLSAYVPLWMISHGGRTALGAGVALVPLLSGWAVGSSFGVKLLLRGGLRASAGLGFLVAGTGAALFGLALWHGAGDGWLYASLGLLGIGLGPAASTCIIAPQARVQWEQRGAITSAVYACRMLGGSLAIALVNLLAGSEPRQVLLVVAIAAAGAFAIERLAPGAEACERPSLATPVLE
ncbi:MAG TPA: MFS transporter [Myxococcaceae bacterium]|nr:MFS transporter [Myxococcaceae bacterium]